MLISRYYKFRYLSLGLLALVMINTTLYSPAAGSQGVAAPFQEHGITANNFMFYHGNLEVAAEFYTDVLGFKKVLDYGTAVMFQIADTSYITLVRGNKKKHNLGGPRPVTVSLVTDELEQWHSHLSHRGVEIIHKEMKGANLRQYSFVALDPAGYYLQFTRINVHPQNKKFLQGLNFLTPVVANPSGKRVDAPPLTVKATITSFYYRGLKTTRKFYEKALGFEIAVEQDETRTYHTSPSGYFRLVDDVHGLHKSSEDISQRKGVMLSLYTDNVDAWFDAIVDHKDITMRTPNMVDIENLREFSFNDPGDYAIEFNYFKATDANRLLLELLNR